MEKELRMDAYYYYFEETGNIYIDRILSAVACAGKAYHHTEDWNDPDDDDMSEQYKIQVVAESAADRVESLESAILNFIKDGNKNFGIDGDKTEALEFIWKKRNEFKSLLNK